MNHDRSFTYTYSAPQQEEVQRIRAKYLPQPLDPLEKLRQLDRSVQNKAATRSLTLGIGSTLVMGTGMSGCLAGPPALFLPGILVGLVGIAGILLAYPLYTRTLEKERARVAPEILRLSEELLN